MRFTSEEAFEANEQGEPIMVTYAAARLICEDHGADIGEFHGDTQTVIQGAPINAATLLAWLGY